MQGLRTIQIPNQEKAKAVEEADDTGSVWERRFSVPIHRETRWGQYRVTHGDTREYTGRYTGRHGRDNREAVRIMIGPSSRPPLLPRRWSRCSNGFSSKIWNCGISFWQRLWWKWQWHRLYWATYRLKLDFVAQKFSRHPNRGFLEKIFWKPKVYCVHPLNLIIIAILTPLSCLFLSSFPRSSSSWLGE